jgi:large subunit ribosomal protein L15
MGTKLSSLVPPKGASRPTKRLGRGTGTGQGTTAGRGEKGQGSRSGKDKSVGFEGGQMPIQRRLPKRGFKNPFRVEYAAVNCGQLGKKFGAGDTVDPEQMRARGIAPRRAKLVKVLGEGELPHALTVKAHAFSKSAAEKIQAAGGTIEIIPGAKAKAKAKATAEKAPAENAPAEPAPSGGTTGA